jgi:hypothetical protein
MNSTEILENLYYEINSIYPLILIPLGTIGNLIVIIIYTRKEFFITSTGFYFAFSAIIDTLALYFGSIKYAYLGLKREGMLNISEFMCKFFRYSIYVLVAISAWTLVAINIDRLLYFYNKKFFNHLHKTKWQIIIILIMVSIILLLNIPNLFFSMLKNSECDSSPYALQVINIIDNVFSILLPYTIMIFSDVFMVLKMYKSKNKVLERKKSQKLAFHYMFLAVGRSCIFLILNFPLSVYLVLASLNELKANNYYLIIFTILNILCYLNYSINLFVHLILNKCFRKRILRIIKSSYSKSLGFFSTKTETTVKTNQIAHFAKISNRQLVLIAD